MKTVFKLIEEHGLTLHGDIEHFAEIVRADYEPDLQAELDATNRQVEILSDALAESRREVAALKAVQEPESFEQWNAKQHGDPEEIGFLQALRIAYCAGQDSVTKATPPAAQRQHVTDGSLCWCEPETSYTDPETGASVIVHKGPQ
jgi:hypothetical protein